MNPKDLSEEQLQKAIEGKTPEEILALAQEMGIELTDEQLESVAGGKKDWTGSPVKQCPDYGSKNVSQYHSGNYSQLFKCNNCGVIWEP